jgi:hypothetical protein
MKDCAYKNEYSEPPMLPQKSEEKEQYPSFSLWSPEAVQAVFGKAQIKAGAEMDMPMRLRIKSVTSNAEKGMTDVSVEIVAVGKGSQVEGEEES